MSRVCLDASVWVKVLTEEPGTYAAQELVLRLLREQKEIIAPPIMKIEVGSVLRKKWSRRMLDSEMLQELWRKFASLPIKYVVDRRQDELAWEIADANRLIHLYDAVYLAVSDGIDYWTADARLVHSVRQSRARIRLLEADR